MLQQNKWMIFCINILLSIMLLTSGCTSLTPVDPQPSPTPPAKLSTTNTDVIVTYNYNATDPVQVSSNNLSLKVGQRLILEPAPGLSKNTRFSSSGGEYFWGDVMKQENSQSSTGKAIFVAIHTGKGKLQIIPNSTEINRSIDLLVTISD